MNQPKPTRIESLDLLKGIVLVLMALDHTRDYSHSAAFIFNPLDPQQTTWPVFLTRIFARLPSVYWQASPLFCRPAKNTS